MLTIIHWIVLALPVVAFGQMMGFYGGAWILKNDKHGAMAAALTNGNAYGARCSPREGIIAALFGCL